MHMVSKQYFKVHIQLKASLGFNIFQKALRCTVPFGIAVLEKNIAMVASILPLEMLGFCLIGLYLMCLHNGTWCFRSGPNPPRGCKFANAKLNYIFCLERFLLKFVTMHVDFIL